jgi:hypothetical protein
LPACDPPQASSVSSFRQKTTAAPRIELFGSCRVVIRRYAGTWPNTPQPSLLPRQKKCPTSTATRLVLRPREPLSRPGRTTLSPWFLEVKDDACLPHGRIAERLPPRGGRALPSQRVALRVWRRRGARSLTRLRGRLPAAGCGVFRRGGRRPRRGAVAGWREGAAAGADAVEGGEPEHVAEHDHASPL